MQRKLVTGEQLGPQTATQIEAACRAILALELPPPHPNPSQDPREGNIDMSHLARQDGVYVLALGEDENRFSPDWLKQTNAHLDKVVAAPAPLVTTAVGKFYSNGLDLDYVMANPDQLEGCVAEVQDLSPGCCHCPSRPSPPSRVTPSAPKRCSPSPTTGAPCARAAGTSASEVDINIPFTPGMAALIQAKLTPQAAINAMSTGHRYDAETALAAGLVDTAAEESTLLETAIAGQAPCRQGRHHSRSHQVDDVRRRPGRAPKPCRRAPAVRASDAADDSELTSTLEVDGEVFQLEIDGSGTAHYGWVSGPNPGYGFSSRPT